MVVSLGLLLAGSVHAQSIPGFQAPEKPKIEEEPNTVKAVRGAAPLNQLYSHLLVDATKVRRLDALTAAEKQKRTEKFKQIGIVRALSDPLNPLSDSAVYSMPEGEVRVAGIVSTDAAAVRVQFGNMSLPDGARVFVYSMSNPDEFFGPYEGHGLSDDGTFWTPAVYGSGVVIEYLAPPGAHSSSTPFEVLAVGHVYKNTVTTDAAGFCENEVNPEWQNVAKSVGLLAFVSGSILGACTGTLLNNAANDQTPYFLTANHCLSSQNGAISVTVYWNYTGGDTPPPGTPQTNGSTLLATGSTSDFTLLRLVNNLPGGLYFSGWDATNITTPKPVTAIHHPEASHRRISFGNAGNPNSGDCVSGNQCLRVDWTSGVTEPGSSGSGIWIGSPSDPGGPRIVGNLTGGYSACNAPPSSQWDVYGRFSITYPSIAVYLGGSCVSSVSGNGNFPASGGSGSISVTAPDGCSWAAVASEPFVTITSATTGTGSGTVTFSVAPNEGYLRSANIMVGTRSFVINQDLGGVCLATPISIGQTVNGTLTTSSCMQPNGIVQDSYSFTATTGQQVAISMTSGAFVTSLRLLGPTGSTQAAGSTRIPSSGYFAIPTTGTYTIVASSLFAANNPTTPGIGPYSLTLSERPFQTLTVTSAGVTSGVPVTVSPADRMGLSNGITEFTRSMYQNVSVTLSAGAVAGNLFRKWQVDGVDFSTSNSTTVNMNADHTVTAVYSPPSQYTLTVGSSNPGTGVQISVSPNDKNGAGSGSTQFARSYDEATSVSLVAPPTAPDGNLFNRWQKDGADYSSSRSIQFTVNANASFTAVYVAPPRFAVIVASQNPDSGVSIGMSPNDVSGAGDGTTLFSRTYTLNTVVTLTAPATVGGNVFSQWRRGTSFWSNNASTTVTVTSVFTMTAVYTPPPPFVQLSQSSYTVNESAGVALINVTRTGDLSGSATVKYATSDATDVNFNCNPATLGQITGSASRKCDYHIASGRVRFAPGESSKQIAISIVNDVYVEPGEWFSILLDSANGAGLGSPYIATITITDDDAPGQPNPIDNTAFYVRMLYVDLLSREPDPAGNAGWIHRIDFCGQPGEPPPPCDRVTVGGDGFLRSSEFFDREFFLVRLYRTALGRIPRYDDIADLAFVSGFLTDADLELNKQEVVSTIMSRAEFGAIYNSLSNAQYVDTMISTAAVSLPAGTRDVWVNALNGGTKTRAVVFRELSERGEVSARYLHEAQVVSCYYGFFTRNPDGAYLNYLQRLDSGEITLADLANAFINAAEYRQRFGP